MKRTIAVLGFVMAVTGCRAVPSEVKVENVLRRELADELARGREVILSYVEIPPHTTLPWHRHPGEEFAYVIEGSVTAHLESGDMRIESYQAGHIPFQAVHAATAGPSGVKLIVARVHIKGQPDRVPAKEPHTHRHDG